MFRYLFLTILLLFSISVYARPISYKGGYSLMTKYTNDFKSIHYHYTPSRNYSIGYKMTECNELDRNLNAIQINYLLNRENKRNSQSNFYLKSAIGSVESEENNEDINKIGGFLNLSYDYETRRIFFKVASQFNHANQLYDFQNQQLKIGFAPYIGNHGDIHSWLILKLDYSDESRLNENIDITPYLRIFQGPYMVELGRSFNGNYLLNFNFIF